MNLKTIDHVCSRSVHIFHWRNVGRSFWASLQKVHAVIGGFHIVPPLDDAYIRMVLADFREINPDYLVVSTGRRNTLS